MWQNGRQPVKYLVYGIIAQFIYVFCYVVSQLIYTLHIEDYEEKIKSSALLAVNIAGLAKFVNFYFNIRKIEAAFDHLTSLINRSDETCGKFQSSMNSGFLIFKIFLISGLSGGSGYIFETIKKGELPLWLPFHVEPHSLAFKIGLIHLIINTIFIVPINICMNILLVLFMSSVTGLLNDLEEKLENLRKLKDSSDDLHGEN